ncbi:MAG: undecaprenyl diphosphate synthase family protein [Candidatus Nanoarchaeia archaeon]
MGLFSKPVRVYLRNLPKHVGIVAVPESLDDLDVLVKNIQRVIQTIIRLHIPIVSFYIMPKGRKVDTSRYADYVAVLMQELHNWSMTDTYQVKVSVLGQWYDLPGRAVEPIKKVIEETQHYDRFFVNFCINYSGQDEMVSAFKLIAKKLDMGKLQPDNISRELVKEHLHTSYFIPPDLFVIVRPRPCLDGFLLWDSPKAFLYPVEKSWENFKTADLIKGVKAYQKR